MCEEAAHIATTIKHLIECIPKHVDTSPLQSLYKKAFYTAPEACAMLWKPLFTTLTSRYNTGEDYQRKMCELYNDGYRNYLDKFIK